MQGYHHAVENKAGQWRVARTRSQWERIVCRQLEQWYGYEYYCPFQPVKRQYTDRIRHVNVPVFKNYVFIRTAAVQEQLNVLRLDGVTDWVRQEGQAVIVRDTEMEVLKSFIDSHEAISVIETGHKVKIREGLFAGQDATVTGKRAQKLYLILPQLGFRLETTADKVSSI